MDAHDVTLALLGMRAPHATICPSEVARALAATARTGSAQEDWRNMMPTVHAAVDLLIAEGRVRLTWKGLALATRAGPYRIGRSTGS